LKANELILREIGTSGKRTCSVAIKFGGQW